MIPAREWQPRRYSYLTLLIFLTIVLMATPLLIRLPSGGLILELAVTGLLFAVVNIVGNERRLWMPVLCLVLLSISLNWMQVLGKPLPWAQSSAWLLDILLLVYVIGLVLCDLFRQKRVSLDTIYGALCGYLLLGVVWTLVYMLTDWLLPGSFEGVSIVRDTLDKGELARHNFEDFLYYSFVTMTTVGDGDLAPVLPEARACAVAEALMGQFYLTVLLSRLIGMYLQEGQKS